MAARRRAHDEEAWRNAKKICQLNAQQLEMARALGMNPKKLPGLRPSPHQHWKLPVGEFIEACYRKRFGGNPLDRHQHGPELGSRKLPIPQRDVDSRKHFRDAASQLGDLICYLMNLADDLQTWLAQGTVAPEVLPQVIAELRRSRRRLRHEGRSRRSRRFPLRPARRATRCHGRVIGSVRPTTRFPSDRPSGRSCISESRPVRQRSFIRLV